MAWLNLRRGNTQYASNDSAGDEAIPPLRVLAARHELHIGAAVSETHLREDPGYREILGREFNMATCENAMKFGPLRPSRETFAFDAADSIVAFAQEHDMAVRGHTLIWHMMLPQWFRDADSSYDEAIDIIRGHIHTVTRHYAGRLAAWDVVNEAFEDDGSWRETPFLKMLGPDYLSMAFHWAHEGDPHAKLFYNDFSADEINAKSDAIYEVLRELISQGTPVHGVGFQMHVNLENRPRPKSVAKNMRRFADLGLEVQVTEMDVALNVPATERDLAEEARLYGDIMEACLDTKAFSAFVTWGVTDRYSWIPLQFHGKGAPLLFDAEGRPKPAYFAVREALQNALKTLPA